MPPFNLSCQVRIRCSYICGEWAVLVQLDCWGQLLCTSSTLKPSWSSKASYWPSLDLSTRFGWLLSLHIVLQEFLVEKGLPSSFPSGFEAYSKHCHANLPLSLDSSLEWSLPGQCSSFYSSVHPCQLYLATVQSVSHSQRDTYPSSLECMAALFLRTHKYAYAPGVYTVPYSNNAVRGVDARQNWA